MKQLMRRVHLIARCNLLYRASAHACGELSACQHSYVLAICRRPGLTAEELAGYLRIHKSNVARQLAAMEEAGYIIRRQSPADKRRQAVYPTEKMERLLPAVRETGVAWREALTEGVAPEDLAVFDRVLEHMAKRACDLTGEDFREEDEPCSF